MATSRSPLAPFAVEDQQLYHLLGQQAALALNNIALVEETGRRLREVNLLLAFSRQLGSLDPDSILISLAESANEVLPGAQAVQVSRWDPARALLAPKAAIGYANNSSLLEITFQTGEALPGQVFQQRQPLRVDEIDFASHYALSPVNLLHYRDATTGRSPVSAMVIPIIGATQFQPFGVLVLENFDTPAAFSDEDQALISSLAQQTALALENAGLYQASEQRAHQLQALTDVAATITSSLQTDELVATLLNQMEAILPYDTGTLWLRQGKELVVRAAHGFKDSDQRIGLSVAIEDSQLLKEMLVTRQAISVANVKEDPRFSALMEYENLSWLGVPLIASGEVIGVIALEKTEATYYNPEHIQAATTFAGQAAVGLQNASLYQESVHRAHELDQSSQILVMLNRLSVELSRSLDIGYILRYASQELFQVIHCSAISAVLFDPGGNAAVYVEFPEITGNLPLPLPPAPLFQRLRQSLGVFISEEAEQEDDLAPLADFLTEHGTRSLLALPLATGSELHGLLLAHSDHTVRFEPDEVELARTISNQVAVAVQNARLFAETRSLTEDLELRVEERTSELAREHKRTETLLRIITELSSSLDLDQVLNRTLRVLNEMIDAEQITVMIARPGEKHLHRLASIGYTAPVENGGSPTPFGIDQGLAGWVYNKRQRVMIDDLLQDFALGANAWRAHAAPPQRNRRPADDWGRGVGQLAALSPAYSPFFSRSIRARPGCRQPGGGCSQQCRAVPPDPRPG